MPKIKSFKAEYGLSIQVKENWHKFNCSLELGIYPSDDVKKVKEMAWNTVTREVEKKLEEIINPNQ